MRTAVSVHRRSIQNMTRKSAKVGIFVISFIMLVVEPRVWLRLTSSYIKLFYKLKLSQFLRSSTVIVIL